MSYAIRNKRTGKFVYGTDRRYCPWRQRTSEKKALIFEDYIVAKIAFQFRGCGKAYEIVPVRIEVIEGEEWKEE